MYFTVGILISAATMLTYFSILWGGQALLGTTDHADAGYRVVYTVAKIMSWLISVIVAYLTNKRWVFRNHVQGRRRVAKQLGKFFAGRTATLVFDYISNYSLTALFLFISRDKLTRLGEVVSWAMTQVVVIILNYLIGKYVVFKAIPVPADAGSAPESSVERNRVS